MPLAIVFNPSRGDYHRHHHHHHHHHHPWAEEVPEVPLAISYKNFAAASPNIKHIGLGVSAVNTVKVLRDAGTDAHVWPATSLADIEALLVRDPLIDHIVINALWIPTVELSSLCNRYPRRHFYANIHSNVGFLSADRGGVSLMREYMQLEKGLYNFRVAANSQKFTRWLSSTYAAPCVYLPNLYHLTAQDGQSRPGWQREGTLRIGSFGAIRPLKNQITAAAAALELGTMLRTPVEFHVSTEREEGGTPGVLGAIQNLYRNHPGAKLLGHKWAPWPEFRLIVPQMHLLIHVSHTESFSMVTGDAIAAGVPVVVSSAIDWTPKYWEASLDNVDDVARVGRHLLTDSQAPADGLAALKSYNRAGTMDWQALEKG